MHGSYLTSMSSSSLSLSPGTIAVNLRALFPSASFVDCADICVTSIQSDSRLCQPGDLFAVVPGVYENAEKYISDAIRNGAKAILTGRPLVDLPVPQCIVGDVRKAYAILCAEFAGRPADQLQTVGVTGTNGKTTVSWLVRAILKNAKFRTGLLGTVEYHDGVSGHPASLTTPDASTLSELLATMVKNKATHAVMEVSSHALDQSRLAGTELNVGVITNVTQDHFDYHQNYESYAACKAKMIQQVRHDGTVILNLDDAACRSFSTAVEKTQTLLTYGLFVSADVTADHIQESARGTRFELVFGGAQETVESSLIGLHNVSNCLAAAAVCLTQGLSLQQIAAGISALACVPGRMEPVQCGQSYTVLIDYAHTDDALSHVIRSARKVCESRVLCVFGAGGDRDTTKRRLLGLAGCEADQVILTSDNPRSEDPMQILEMIAEGCRSRNVSPELIVDRKEAIFHALAEAKAGDLVLIAGKGHECEQVIGERRIPFSDRLVVEDYFRNTLVQKTARIPA